MKTLSNRPFFPPAFSSYRNTEKRPPACPLTPIRTFERFALMKDLNSFNSLKRYLVATAKRRRWRQKSRMICEVICAFPTHTQTHWHTDQCAKGNNVQSTRSEHCCCCAVWWLLLCAVWYTLFLTFATKFGHNRLLFLICKNKPTERKSSSGWANDTDAPLVVA